MVLNVISVIEEQEVVQPTVVADRTSRVFIMPLEITETEPYQKAWKIGVKQKIWRTGNHRRP